MHLTYESLDAQPLATTHQVLDFLEISAPDISIQAGNVRMADQLSEDWAARYRSETN